MLAQFKDRRHGTLVMVGQPAEEVGSRVHHHWRRRIHDRWRAALAYAGEIRGDRGIRK